MTTQSPVDSPASETVIPDPEAVSQEVVQGATPDDANPADPSTVDQTDAKQPLDLLSVVKSAIEKPIEPEESSTAESKPAEAEVEAPAVAEVETEDDANLPFHNHPRWKAVIAERDGLKDSADRWNGISGFMQEHGLSGEQMAEGYEIMALLQSGDPVKLSKAREWFAERLDVLDESLGHVLPEDLQERVDSGMLDEAGALEIAQSRASVSLRRAQDERTAEAAASADVERRATETRTSMVSAVEAWEARAKASDPDYSKKAELVEAKCLAIVQRTGKPPLTPEEATQLADQALSEVNAVFKAALPKPRQITPAPAGSSTTVPAPAPASLKDAIRGALAS